MSKRNKYRGTGLIHLFIYLAALGLSCSQALDRPSLQHEGSSVVAVGSSSLTRDGTQVPCIGSMES